MKNKKLFMVATGIAVVSGLAAIVPMGVYAAETDTTPGTTFIQRLAARLGVDATNVQNAFEATHNEVREESLANRAAEIAVAVTEGRLTQREADILTAIPEVMETLRPAGGNQAARENFRDLTQEERESKMEEFRAEKDQKLVDALNAKGLNTTLEEIQSTHEAARAADLEMGPKGEFGGNGQGKFMMNR